MTNLRSFARYVRHVPDRVAHPLRRARMRNILAAGHHLQSVLFICHGNICRSPYAAASFTRALPDALRARVRASSAGFIGPGRPSPEEALHVAQRRGVDLTSHRSVVMTEEMLQSADLIIVMEPAQRRALLQRFWGQTPIVVLGDLDPMPIGKRAIRDPFGAAEEVFDESYERIDRCIDSLLAAMQIPLPRRRASGNAGQHRNEFRDRRAQQSEGSRH